MKQQLIKDLSTEWKRFTYDFEERNEKTKELNSAGRCFFHSYGFYLSIVFLLSLVKKLTVDLLGNIRDSDRKRIGAIAFHLVTIFGQNAQPNVIASGCINRT